MINFQNPSLKSFLSDYWQKKPLIIRNALPDFVNPLSADELAGLALEEDIESRIVRETPEEKPYWHLKHGPFTQKDFKNLPATHWTLLVQGVDRLVPEVGQLLDQFDFIPQWRVDDIMISYAALHGSVGPHYDNYDVFLYQAQGRREWALTSKECTPNNYMDDLELRIMKHFDVEERIVLEEGDMLYLPPHIGHYGISRSENCMTYSFGYRSYQGQELWDSLGDYLSEKEAFEQLYQDPDWSDLKNTSEIPVAAWKNAQKVLRQIVDDDCLMKSWFACFATQLNQSAEQHLPIPLTENETINRITFIDELKTGANLVRDPSCRFAYQRINRDFDYALYINGCEWKTEGVSPGLLCELANNRYLVNHRLVNYLNNAENQVLLFDLWKLQWLQLEEI